MEEKMKRLIIVVAAITLVCAMSLGVYANDAYSGTGESTVKAHVDSRYYITIPATIDLSNGEQGQVTISDASLEDGATVKVLLVDNEDPNGITLYHSSGLSYISIPCSISNENGELAVGDTPIASFTNSDLTENTATKYFTLTADTFGKPGDYSGTMHYRFELTNN